MITRDIGSNSRGHATLAISTVFSIIATFIFGLRLYTRLFIVRYSGKDDVCIAIGLIFSIGLTICIGLQVKYGLGLHQDEISHESLVSMLKAFWVSLWIYYLSLLFIKIGLILLYLRIFTQRWFRITAWTLFAIVVAYGVWTVFSSIFSCVPVEAFWDRSIEGHCLPHAIEWYTNAAINIAIDLALVVLPIPVVHKLHLPQRQRFALIAVFALAGFVCIVSGIRVKALIEIANSTDVSYTNPPAAVWSSIEVNVGVICASLPSLKAALVRFFPRLFSSRSTNGSRDQLSKYGPAGRSFRVSSIPTDSHHSGTCARPNGMHVTPISHVTPLISTKRVDSKDMITEMNTFSFGTQSESRENQINVVRTVEQAVENLPPPSPLAELSPSKKKTGLGGRVSALESDSDSEKGLCAPPESRTYHDDFDGYTIDR